MSSRRLVPLGLLALMGVVAVGLAVLGLLQAPPAANATVANAAAKNLGVNVITVRVIEGPGSTESAVLFPPTHTAQPEAAAVTLDWLENMTTSGPWSDRGHDVYRFDGPLGAILPQLEQQVAKDRTLGVHIDATLSTRVKGGYATVLIFKISASARGQHRSEVQQVQFPRIGTYVP